MSLKYNKKTDIKVSDISFGTKVKNIMVSADAINCFRRQIKLKYCLRLGAGKGKSLRSYYPRRLPEVKTLSCSVDKKESEDERRN